MRKLFIGALSALALWGAWETPNAHADTREHNEYVICGMLAADPTVSGVDSVARAWFAQVGSDDQSVKDGADTLVDAVRDVCPQYRSIVIAWVQKYQSSSRGSVV